MVILSELTEVFFPEETSLNIPVGGLVLDSRQVKPGDVFIAYLGYKTDGRHFISQAMELGAVAVLQESYDQHNRVVWKNGIPILSIVGLPKHISQMAAHFYHFPSREMLTIGITGTNGKTTCAYLLAQALERLGKKSGMIGTLGSGLLDQLTTSMRTTPDPILIQKTLHQLREEKTQAVMLEATSHGLIQGRVTGIEFDLGLFTNLTRDHLDYHGDMETYEQAKRLLFTMPSMRYGVFNLESEVGLKWLREFKNHFEVCGYTTDESRIQSDAPVVFASKIELQETGVRAMVVTPWGEGRLSSPLIGRMNVSNLLGVLAILGLLKYDLQESLDVLANLLVVPGRMEALGGGKDPLVVIDFAHSPDALKQVLSALKEQCSGRLFCLFGCGGGRDRGIRPMMAKIVEEFADHVILTNDNPRLEDPNQIVNDILSGFKHPQDVEVEYDRSLAIGSSLQQARSGDIVLLAGKGHEVVQVIGDQLFPFDEKGKVKNILRLKERKKG